MRKWSQNTTNIPLSSVYRLHSLLDGSLFQMQNIKAKVTKLILLYKQVTGRVEQSAIDRGTRLKVRFQKKVENSRWGISIIDYAAWFSKKGRK